MGSEAVCGVWLLNTEHTGPLLAAKQLPRQLLNAEAAVGIQPVLPAVGSGIRAGRYTYRCFEWCLAGQPSCHWAFAILNQFKGQHS